MSSRRNRRAHPSGSRRIPGGSAGTPTRRRGSPSRCRLRVSASRTRDAPGAGGLMESGSQMQAWPRGRHGNADPTTQELPGKEGEKAARSADGNTAMHDDHDDRPDTPRHPASADIHHRPPANTVCGNGRQNPSRTIPDRPPSGLGMPSSLATAAPLLPLDCQRA